MSHCSRHHWEAIRFLGILFALTLSLTLAQAQPRDYLRSRDRLNGRDTIEAFEEATRFDWNSVSAIMDGENAVALGILLDKPGLLVTKASELPDKPLILFNNGKEFAAEVVGKDSRLDLAVLKFPPQDLPVLRPNDSVEELKIGAWVAAPGQDKRLWAGILSAKSREIPKTGALGIALDARDGDSPGVRIDRVFEGSAAERDGLKKGDFILSINAKPVTSVRNVIETVRQYDPEETLEILISRDGTEQRVSVTLGFYSSIFRDPNQRMSGGTSLRKTGFSKILQHSIPLDPNVMGGPLLDLDGRIIGVNIARVDRVTTYALPWDLVQKAIEEMAGAQ